MCFLSIFPFAGLLIILLFIFLKVVSLKRKGVNVKAASSKSPGAFLLLYPVFLLILLLWLIALAGQTFSISTFLLPTVLTKKLIYSPELELTGAVFIFLSVLLMLITLVHFKTSLRFGMSRNNPGKLITTGIFSFSRNPFFLSINLYFIGQAMLFPGVVFIVMALMAMTGIHFFILKEEKFLVTCYGEEYTTYQKKVGRYF